MNRRVRWLLLGLVLGGAVTVGAHEADALLVSAREVGPGEWEESVRMSRATLLLLVPGADADGDHRLTERELTASAAALEGGVWDGMPVETSEGPCGRTAGQITLEPKALYVTLSARFRCAAGLSVTQRFRLLDVLPGGHHVQFRSTPGEAATLSGGRQSAVLGSRARPSAAPAAVR